MSEHQHTAEASFWSKQYQLGKTGWNIGYASPPLKAYFDQVGDKNKRILVPGAGFGWEAAYLHQTGFKHVTALDFSPEAKVVFFEQHPSFPQTNFFEEDFFLHQGTYDLIVEHTFFSGLPVEMRQQYVEKAAALLAPHGKIVGLLFNHLFHFQGPPFGGTPDEYLQLFSSFFSIYRMETAVNSIKPRAGRELFCIFQKK